MNDTTHKTPNLSPQRLILGCMGLGGGWNQNPISQQDIQQAHKAIDAALEVGIDRFDHADIYTFGKAEHVFGEVLKQRPELKEQIQLQSKCGIRFADEDGPKRYDLSKAWILASVDGILRRLQVEQLDTLMLHRPDPLMDIEEIAEAFTTLEAQGKVKAFGVSNIMAPQLAILQPALPMPLVCNQLEISLSQLNWLEQAIVANNTDYSASNLAPGTLEMCRQSNIEIQAWGSLSQGMFTGREINHEAQHIQQTAKLVREMAERYTCSPEAIVLAFILRHPFRIAPVIGSSHPDRIRACAQATQIRLARGDWYRLYESARGREIP